MVKKIGGKSSGPSGTTPIQPTKPVGASEVGSVQKVEGAEADVRTDRATGAGRAMTRAEHDQLMQLIHEEAERMFGPEGLPKSKRDAVEGAVKMAVKAGIIFEDGDVPDGNVDDGDTSAS